MNLSIGDLNIKCKDVEKSLLFYKETLGFTEIEREGDCVWLELNGRKVLLMPLPAGNASRVSFDFITDDVRNVKERLNRSGYKTEDRTYSDFNFFAVQDPDGNEFEIIEIRQ